MLKVVSSQCISLPEVKELLRKKEVEEGLSSIENATLDYISKFTKISYEKAVKLKKELINNGIPEEIAVQIINILPRSTAEIRVMIAPWSRTLPLDIPDKIKTILDKYIKD